jgi:hypothetical protein
MLIREHYDEHYEIKIPTGTLVLDKREFIKDFICLDKYKIIGCLADYTLSHETAHL